MKTFILTLDAASDPKKAQDYLDSIPTLEWGDFSLNIHDKHPEVRSGDNFFLYVKGIPTEGLVARGFFIFEIFEDVLNPPLYEAYLQHSFMVSWHHPKGILSAEELRKTIPTFPWGDSGEVHELTSPDDKAILSLWRGFEKNFEGEYSDTIEKLVDWTERPTAGIDEAVYLAACALEDKKGADGRPAILHALAQGLAGTTDDEIICGILKDVVTIAGWALGKIRQRGFEEHIIDWLQARLDEK